MSPSAIQPVDYVLGRGVSDSVRLDAQHLLWKMHNNYLLHPSIQVTDQFEVAELGCGTGIWSLDLSTQLPPHVKLHGFDISDKQFPSRDFWPENVDFSILNSLKEPPTTLHNRFDVVYLRMWASILTPATLPTVVHNIYKMLKPGGHLQWDEADIINQQVRGDNAIEFAKNVSSLFDMVGFDFSWLAELPTALEAHGFVKVAMTKKSFPSALVQLGTNTNLLAYAEILRGITGRVDYRNDMGFPFDKALKSLLETHTSGIVYTWGPTSTLAQKPSN